MARSGQIKSIRYEAPFFFLNDRLRVLLKCSRACVVRGVSRSRQREQDLLRAMSSEIDTAIGLICGDDGVAALHYQPYLSIASPRQASIPHCLLSRLRLTTRYELLPV